MVFGLNEFYKKGCQEKAPPERRSEIVSRSSPLCFVIREEVWPVIHSRTVSQQSGSEVRVCKTRQAE